MTPPTKRRSRTDPTAVQLIEEAIHLLRQASLSTWTVYAAGSTTWVLGFLFFWSHTSWFAPSDTAVAWSALGLVGLFVLLKTVQTDFCERLLAQRLGAPFPPRTLGRALRVACTQTQIQSWGLIVLPIALVISVPFGWIYAYFQTVTVLGTSEGQNRIAREAAIEARRWPGQNHLALTYLSVIAGAAWINLAATFYGVPWLANHLLGIRNMFGFGGMWWLNTTFLASVTALTWLAVDPLVKAFYVLRVFYGRSQRTGEDLRVDLLAADRLRRLRGVAVIVALLFLGVTKSSLHAGPSPEAVPVQSVDAATLNRAIDQVLARRDFQWQMRPKPQAEKAEKKDNVIRRFLRQGVEIIKTMVGSVVDVLTRVKRWIRGLFPGKESDSDTSSRHLGFSLSTLRLFLYALMAVGAGLILVVVGMMWRNRHRPAAAAWTARAVTSAQPDLRDDQLEAAHLPVDGWLALAREQIAKGEWRLALRALYLATLARLAMEGLVTLVKSKTNLDYERELRRRAPANVSLLNRFTDRRQEFEAVWYGQAVAAEDRVRSWFNEIEGGASP